jgi:hypothetical protein
MTTPAPPPPPLTPPLTTAQLLAQRLYGLLPAVYRTRDAASGGQLQALLSLLAAQAAIVEDNIQQLYDDQFIETCAPWAIPYIADLLGYNSAYELTVTSTDTRSEVANTIGYRRRKGTAIALEQVVMDISGRAAVVVEEFGQLITDESMRSPLPGHNATVDLRQREQLVLIGTAFDTQDRTIDVRGISPARRPAASPDPTPLASTLHGTGRANIPDVAIHLWRWQAFTVLNAPAFPVGGGRYKFSPLGADLPLFSAPPARTAFQGLTTRADVPAPIAREEFDSFYGPGGSILLTAGGAAVPAAGVRVANLADRPGGSWCTVPSQVIAIDPVLGRIQYAADLPLPDSLEVSYSYGLNAPVGGGPYDRTESASALVPANAVMLTVGPGADFPDLASAVAAWNLRPPGSTGLIVLAGYQQLAQNLTGPAAIQLPAGSSLLIAAGQPLPPGSPVPATWDSSLAAITGSIEVTGVAGPPGPDGVPAPPGQLAISGVWLAGQLTVTGAPSAVQVADCTLVPGLGLLSDGEPVSPGDPSILIQAPGSSLTLTRVISGPVGADESGTTRITGSIIDATSPYYVAYAGTDLASPGADLHIEDSTVIGKVRPRTITLASDTIFYALLGTADPWPAPVWASRRQAGCVRFCVLPPGSVTPRQYQCLPPDAASAAALQLSFVTLQYGQPGYAMLSGDVPAAIWTAASNGSQPGAYLQAQETEAVGNVVLRAPEFLPALLESGIYLHPSQPQQRAPLAPAPYGSAQAYAAAPLRPVAGRPDQAGYPAAASDTGIGAALI